MFKNLIKKNKANKGFTLIEILIVIGIIAILAAIVIIAINPAKQFAQARNTQRTANVNAILNAIGQRVADNKGVFDGPFKVGTVTYTCPDISAANNKAVCDGSGSCPVGGFDFSCLVPTYIPAIPKDPTWKTADAGDTLYKITVGKDCSSPANDAPSRVKVTAPLSTGETSIPDAATTEICVVR